MKTKLFLLTSLISVFFINTVKGQIVIHASADDITITNSNAAWGSVNQLTARLNASEDQCYVIPFQLPTIPAGESITDVSFSYNIFSYSNQLTVTNIDFYGLPYRATSTVDLTNDYYVGSLDGAATLLQDNILVGNLSEVGIQSTNASTNISLVNYIEAQYNAGAVAGDYIFLRFSADAAGNTESWNLDSENSSNTSLHPILTITTAPTGGNIAPVLNAIGNINLDEGQVLNITVNTSDIDLDALTITASNVPGFVTFTDHGNETGTINISPLIGNSGSYNMTIQVSDGALTDQESITIQVNAIAAGTNYVITGTNDGYVSDPAIILSNNPYLPSFMKLGKSAVDGSGNTTSAIIPFQLPERQVGATVINAKLNVYISYGREYVNANVDLYGLTYSNTSETILATDHYAGSFLANQGARAVGLEDDYFAKNVAQGILDTPRWEETTAITAINDYINAQYDAGAVAGDWIFFRLSMDDDAMTGAHYFKVEGDDSVTPAELSFDIYSATPVAPILASIGNITIEENEVQNITVNTTDANGDALTITASNVPSFVSFLDNGDGTATITLNPVVGDEGVYPNIDIQVSDGTFTDSETISITVTKLNTLIEIIATGATGYVSDSILVPDGDIWSPSGKTIKNPEIADDMKVGKSDVTGEAILTSAILPFQLPARPSGQTVQDVKLSIFVSCGREWSSSKVDLYGLPYKSASTLFSRDYYSGAFGDDQNGRGAVGLEEDILAKTNPLSLLDTQRWVSTTNTSAIAAYIDAQYDAGAAAGDWIFFRFTVNNPGASIGYHFFGIDGGDGEGWNVDGKTHNSNPKPSILKLDFYNSLETVTTWDGSTWSNGAPDNRLDAIIDADIAIAGAESIQAKNVTMQNNVIVTVNKGGNFVVNNSLTVDTGSKVLVESGGSFITSDDAATITINGDFWVERDSRATLSNYTYWSSPVNTTIQTALLNSGSPIVYRFDTPTHNDANDDGQDDGFAAWIRVTDAMNPGQGYAAYGSDDGVTASIQSVTFKAGEGSGATKEINNGVVSINTYLSDNTDDPNVDDWNLLGNPYPTSILGRPFMVQNSTVGTLYFWTHTYPISGNFYSVNDYASYNLSGGVDGPQGVEGGVVPDGKIASGQGFFTDVTVAGTVSFNASMQIHNVYDDYNNNFYRGTNTSNNETEPNPFIEDRFWVNVYNDAIFNQILIAFAEEATNNFDHQYDGEKLDLGNELMFYSIENDRNLVIQGKPLFEGDEVIPLGYKSKINTATTFKIELPFIEGTFKEDTPIYLVDKYLNITHDLKQGFYEFEISEVGVVNNRFEIVFQNSEALNVEDLDLANDFVLYPNPIESSFELRYNNHEIKQINLFNIQGKLIKEIEILENDIYNIQDLSTGIYFLKIAIEENHTITKKVIKL